MPVRGLRFWGMISAALHAAVLLAILLDLATRKFQEPEEQAISVEVVSDLPTQMAQGDSPAPRPADAPEPVPPPPTPEPPNPTPPRNAAVAPPPPPPPPPPAPAPAPAPPTPQARPTPPTPAPAPEPTPAPQQRPQQVAQAPTPPQPTPPTPAPPRPEPPLPLPPPPVPPPPQPATAPGTGQTPPVRTPQERSTSVLNTLERLRQQQQREAPTARANQPQGAPQRGGGAPNGTAQLTAGEIRGIADQISECWSVDAGAMGLSEIVVELRVDIDANGVIRNARAAGSVPADPRARAVFERARRALLDDRCATLRIPRDKIATVAASTFRFNPRGLVR